MSGADELARMAACLRREAKGSMGSADEVEEDPDKYDSREWPYRVGESHGFSRSAKKLRNRARYLRKKDGGRTLASLVREWADKHPRKARRELARLKRSLA